MEKLCERWAKLQQQWQREGAWDRNQAGRQKKAVKKKKKKDSDERSQESSAAS